MAKRKAVLAVVTNCRSLDDWRRLGMTLVRGVFGTAEAVP
jgi:hypothetical protein